MGLNVFYNILGLIRRKRWGKASKWLNNSTETTAGYMHMINLRVFVNAFALTFVTLAGAGKLQQFSHLDSHWMQPFNAFHCRKLSVEVHEALSTLIFASSRCGELPELHSLRNLFKQHFGQKFERVNVELLPGNAVNSEIKHNLTMSSVTEEVKLQLTNEIATEFTHQSAVLNQQNYLFPALQKASLINFTPFL
ncbi:uncharacterized protein Fot_39660 [Forsythia ovata]|uniref:Uncharacterized protein n=1 Tax=Forsythia ovata TaxID=205694 RepID=A0ABD1S572_9LAMI